MKKSVIYKITNPSGKFYVGKTTDFDTRIRNYRNLNNTQQKAIHASIIKYGWENHKVEILEEAPPHILNELEVKYIKELNSFSGDNKMGLNLTRGGEGSLGRKDSEETKLKRAQKHIGRKRPEKTRKLISESKKGKIPYPSTLPRSEKQWHHIKYGNLGRKKSIDAMNKEIDSKLKNFLEKYGGVLQLDKNGNIIKEWQMLPKHIAKEININDSFLYKAIKNQRKSAKGFFWKYKHTDK